MVTVAQLVQNVLTEGNFDATEPQALQWLSRRHELICARSKCFRKNLEVGPTVAGTRSYAVPAEVVEIHEVQVTSSPETGSLGVPYGAAKHSDIAEGALGYIWLGGLYLAVGGGIYTRGYGATGEDKLSLYPTPTENGLQIKVFAVCRPEDLTVGEDAGLKIPPEFADALVSGAIATGLSRLEARGDLAAEHESRFAQACDELRGQTAKRFRGSGPATIRVIGFNA